ncbi:hypothetical protein [Kocuria sp. HSID16901]|uniref:hypothetical protein n=1 Tax=Kocuria sp. HSID16901 TaxID=2419505 RepID=UPI000F887C0D|nr:hypothetical protein [Kocuria sp. HSID16901]RUQ19808.1 hypothetical protein D8M21_10825 [Kocuria sp. HSID16901]
MTDRQPLDFPRITAIAHGEGRVDVTINGVTHVHEHDDNAQAVQAAMDDITKAAQDVDRPVKVTAQFGLTARDMVVDVDGSRRDVTADYGTTRQPWYKRTRVLIALILVGLVLIAATIAISVAATHAKRADTTSPSPSRTAQTLDSALAAGTKPAVSLDTGYTAYQTEDNSFEVVETSTGKQKTSDDLADDESDEESVSAEILPNKDDGFLVVTGNQYRLWTPNDGLSATRSFNPDQQLVVTRQGQNYLIPKESSSRPDRIQYIEDQTSKTFESPAEKSSFLGIHDDKALWAHLNKGEPEVISATDTETKGKKQKLAKPSKDAKLSQWIGINNHGEVLTVWNADGADTLSIQAADSDKISHTVPVNLPDGAPSALDSTATSVLLGDQVIDAHSGKASDVDIETAKDAEPRVHGFSSHRDKSTVWIDTDHGVSNAPSELTKAYARATEDGGTWVGTTSSNHITLDPERNKS